MPPLLRVGTESCRAHGGDEQIAVAFRGSLGERRVRGGGGAEGVERRRKLDRFALLIGKPDVDGHSTLVEAAAPRFGDCPRLR